MASAMIVPNVAVVFAEAPKAGLATVAKETTDVATYPVKLTVVTDTGERYPLGDLKLPAGQQTFDISGMLNIGGWELDRSVKYYADFNYDATKFPINVSTEYTSEVEVFVTAKKEEVKTYNYKINLIDYETNQKIADGDLTFNAAGDQTYDITSVLNHYGVELADIDGYKGVDAANFPFTVNKDGAANVKDIYVSAKKEEAKTYSYKINLIDNKTNQKLADGDLVFNAAGDQTYDITPILSHYGVELADINNYKGIDAANFPFTVNEDGAANVKDIYVTADTQYTTTLSVTFITSDDTVVGEKTFEKTTDNDADVVFGLGTDITLPEGYHWVDYNDQIKDVTLPAGSTGGHYMYVSANDEEVKTYSYKINLIDNETNQKLADGELVFNAAGDQTYDITPILKHYGVKLADLDAYKDVDAANFPFTVNEDGVANVKDIYVEQDDVAPTPTEDPKKDDTKKDDPKKEETKKDDPKKEETKKPSKTADTADTSDVAAYAIPLVMSMVAISAIVVGKKKLS